MSGSVCHEEAGEGVHRLRVLHRLLQLEEKYLPSPSYMAVIRKEPETREVLLKWALEVCCEHGCAAPVFPLAVSLLDRYLSTSMSLPVSPACLTAACILIASKLSGSRVVGPDALCVAADASFLPGHLRDMEIVVLATLGWDAAAVTPHDFLSHFLSILLDKEDAQDRRNTAGFSSSVRSHSDTLVALCVSDARVLGSPPSLVAAAALSSAWQALGGPAPLMDTVRTTLASLCRTEKAVLQYHCELIEGVTSECLSTWDKQVWHLDAESPGEEVAAEDRASTPTDLREVRL